MLSDPNKITENGQLMAWRFTAETDWDALGDWCGAEDYGHEWQEMFMTLPSGARANEGDWIASTDNGLFVAMDHPGHVKTHDTSEGNA